MSANENSGGNSQNTGEELSQTILQLHTEALNLAQEALGGANRNERAGILNQRLQELESRLSEVPPTSRNQLKERLGEVRTYLTYAQAMENTPAIADLDTEVNRLSAEAFKLAKQAVTRGGDEFKRKAEELDHRLEEVLPKIQRLPSDKQPGLMEDWNNARLDLTYILSGNNGPSSTRLFYFLQELKSKKPL